MPRVNTEIESQTSRSTYGDLTNSNNTIFISNGVDGTIKYTVNSQIIEFDQLKAEAKKQGITLTTEEALNATNLTGLNIDQLTKAKSIKTYGDFTNLDNVVIDYVDNMSSAGSFRSEPGYLIQVGSKEIMSYGEFARQIQNQGITKTNTTGKLNWTTADKKHYGDLRNQTIKVDYVGSDYTFQVGSKKKITSLKDLNDQLNNQGNTELNYTIDDLSSNLTIDTTKTIAKAKVKAKTHSIAIYGDLTNQAISVSNGVDGTIKYTVNSQIIEFDQLKTEASKQEITLTTEESLDSTQLKRLDVAQLTKAKSIKRYGDLTNLNNVIVDYVGTNYTFQVDSKQKITSLKVFKTELGNQGITTTIDDIDDVVEAIDGLTGTLDTTNAKAKKTTVIISESDQNSQFNKLLIIPIVSSVIVVMILISLLLKKYFKNKKSK